MTFAVKKSRADQLSVPSRVLTLLQRSLHPAILVIAVASALAGAVLSVLPALILGLVTMFYNSAGGFLIFLGSLIPALPHPVIAGHGSSGLPAFQQLDSDPGIVMLRSGAATLLCSIAAAMMMVASQRRRDGQFWLMVGLCCLLAAIAGGRSVAVSVVPAIVISIGHLIYHQMRQPASPT